MNLIIWEISARSQLVYSNLLAATENTGNLTPELAIDRIRNATENVNIQISYEYLRDMSQNFTTHSITANPRVWLFGLEKCIRYLENGRYWYEFLCSTYSLYEFRHDLSKYNVANLDDWGVAGKPQGIHIDRDNFAKFVQKKVIYYSLFKI